jgi:abequosyltransferase
METSNQPLLSICIPVFNRRRVVSLLLKQLLNEIDRLQSSCGEVEIIVSDNGSSDGTPEEIDALAEGSSHIRILKSLENMGFGFNLNKSTAAATGRFIWLLGSDEEILPGSLVSILKRLDGRSSDGKSARLMHILRPLDQKGVTRPFFNGSTDIEMGIGSTEGLCAFLDYCANFSAAFSFMSSIIVERTFWQGTELDHGEIRDDYSHMVRMFKGLALSQGPVNAIVHDDRYYRCGVETNEWNVSGFRHFLLDITTAKRIVASYFDDDESLRGAFRRLLIRNQRFMLLKGQCSRAEWLALGEEFEYFGFPRSIVRRTTFDLVRYGFHQARRPIYRMRRSWKEKLKSTFVGVFSRNGKDSHQ